MPTKPIEAELRGLSPALQRDLRELAEREGAPRLDRARSPIPVGAAVIGATLTAWIGRLVLRGEGTLAGVRGCDPWPTDARLQVAIFAALAAGLLVPSLAALVRRRRGSLGSFWGIAPPWLVDVEDQRVRLYPLARLAVSDAAPDQVLRLRVAGRSLDVDLRPRGGRAFAEAVTRTIEEVRAPAPDPRAGYRDDARREEAPSPVLAGSARPIGDPRAARRRVAVVFGAAMLGAILGATLLPAARAGRERRCLRDACAVAGVLAACPRYLERFHGGPDLDAIDDGWFRAARGRLPDLDAHAAAFPQSRHAAERVAARRALFTAALPAGRARHPLFGGALQSLADARGAGELGSTLHLRFSHEVTRRRLSREEIQRLEEKATSGGTPIEVVTALAGAAREVDPIEVLYPEDRMDPPSESAYPDAAAREHERALAAELERALGQGAWALGLRVKRLEGPAAEGAVVLDVRYEVAQRRALAGEPRDDLLGGGKRPRPVSYWALTFRFTVARAGAAEAPIVVEAHPAADLSCVERRDLYLAQRRAAFRLLAERLEGHLGLPVHTDESCPRARAQADGPPADGGPP